MTETRTQAQELPPNVRAMMRGMRLTLTAADAPDRVAVIAKHGNRTFAELNANANRLARGLRRRGIVATNGFVLHPRERSERRVQARVLRPRYASNRVALTGRVP